MIWTSGAVTAYPCPPHPRFPVTCAYRGGGVALEQGPQTVSAPVTVMAHGQCASTSSLCSLPHSLCSDLWAPTLGPFLCRGHAPLLGASGPAKQSLSSSWHSIQLPVPMRPSGAHLLSLQPALSLGSTQALPVLQHIRGCAPGSRAPTACLVGSPA